MAPKIAIVYYSMYGHIKTLAEAEAKGIKEAGGTVDFYQLPETLPENVLQMMHAPPKPTDIPTLDDPATLEQYDGFLFGIPTRYGNFPAQWKAFWDKTGQQWQKGSYWGKYAGLFVSTASMGGGQESTALATMSTLAHHGIIYVPLGYKTVFADLADLSEVRGGSAWGAGTFAGADGSRQPTEKELKVATEQDGGAAGAGAAGRKDDGVAVARSEVKPAETEKTAEEPKKDAAAGGAAAGGATTGAATAANGEQKKEGEKEKGLCGLPIRCTIS